MTFKQLIAKRTRRLLKSRNWTQYKLAQMSAIPFSTLSYTLNHKGISVTSETLLNICRGLDITLAEFFDDNLFSFENIDDNE